MVQVTEFIDAFEYKYPGYQVAILFDWSTTHHKMADDASHVKKFGVDPGFQKFGTGPKKGENKPFVCSDMELTKKYPSDAPIYQLESFDQDSGTLLVH